MAETVHLTSHEIELEQVLGDSGIPLCSGGVNYDAFHPIHGLVARDLIPVVSLWKESEVPTAEEVEAIRDAGRVVAQRRFGSTPQEGVFAEGAIMGMLFKMGENAWSFRRANWTEGPTWHNPKPLYEVLAGI